MSNDAIFLSVESSIGPCSGRALCLGDVFVRGREGRRSYSYFSKVKDVEREMARLGICYIVNK